MKYTHVEYNALHLCPNKRFNSLTFSLRRNSFTIKSLIFSKTLIPNTTKSEFPWDIKKKKNPSKHPVMPKETAFRMSIQEGGANRGLTGGQQGFYSQTLVKA